MRFDGVDETVMLRLAGETLQKKKSFHFILFTHHYGDIQALWLYVDGVHALFILGFDVLRIPGVFIFHTHGKCT